MSMYSDVERLQGILRDLGGLINEPNALPDVTREYIEVCVHLHWQLSVCASILSPRSLFPCPEH